MAVYLLNNIWQISWPNPARPGYPFRESTGMRNEEAWDEEKKRFITKAEIKTIVKAMEAKKRVEQAEGKNLDIDKKKRIKFKDFAIILIDNHLKLNTTNWKNGYGGALVPENPTGLIPKFGDMWLDEIIPLDIEGFKKQRLASGTLPQTINSYELTCLKVLFKKAVLWDYISINPMDKVKKFKCSKKRVRYFLKEELKKIVNKAAEPLRSMILLALLTGMRVSEILRLKWRDIDFSKNTLCIDYQKNKKLDYIPINQAKSMLMKIRRQGNSEYVFNKSNNEPYVHYEQISSAFKELVDELGIKGTSFHTLRHTFASYLAIRGVDLYKISKLMRHSSIKQTEDYAHLSPQSLEKAVDILSLEFDFILPEIDNINITHRQIESEKEDFNSIVSGLDI